MTLCDTFKRLSFDTWDTINRSRKVNFQLKEETFTDVNVLALKARHDKRVKTKVFTKWDEGINGADWEWWFKGNTGKWIGFRIQAKIINIQSEEFEHLHYKSAKSGIYQCDKLIKNSLTLAHPKIPLYCYYINTNNISNLKTWSCGSMPAFKDLYGCSLTSAFRVKTLRTTNSKKLIDLQNDLKPWHCLVCCSHYGKGDFITNIQAYAKDNFLQDIDNLTELEVEMPETFVTDNPPAYVLSIIENEDNDNIQPPDDDIRGIVIISEE